MKRKLFLSLGIILLILSVGCVKNKQEVTNISTPENTITDTNYQENFNEDDRIWEITFDEIDNSIKKEFSISEGDMLTVEGEMESGFISIYLTQEGLDKDDKDILRVPIHGDTSNLVLYEWWDFNKKLILELHPKNAKNGEVKIKLIKQEDNASILN